MHVLCAYRYDALVAHLLLRCTHCTSVTSLHLLHIYCFDALITHLPIWLLHEQDSIAARLLLWMLNEWGSIVKIHCGDPLWDQQIGELPCLQNDPNRSTTASDCLDNSLSHMKVT